MAIHPVGLCGEGLTTVGAGSPVLLRGERVEFGAGQMQRVSFPIDVNLSAKGAAASTATAQIETSPANQDLAFNIAGTGTQTVVDGGFMGAAVTAAITGVGGGVTATLQSSPDNSAWTNVAGWIGLTAIAPAAVIQVAGARWYRWNVTAYVSGAPVLKLSDWTIWGSPWSTTIPASGYPTRLSEAPLVGRLQSSADYVRVNVTAISGATVQGWVKRRDA